MTEPAAIPRRALALDALRGLSILMMVFSGRIPYGVLPDWMYHAQVPPPEHVFNPNLPGITWVDLVFPFFLFTMGAAIPLALQRRVDAGISTARIAGGVVLRGVLLAWFAIFVMHIRPWNMEPPGTQAWLLSLAGFVLLFPMIGRFPWRWKAPVRYAVHALGWIGAVAVLALVRYKDGSGFSVERSDIIILVLSNVAVAGGLLWLFTRGNPLLRLGLLGFLVALRLGGAADGWVQWFVQSSPVPWLFQVRFLQYLFLVIPGTVAGDLILEWMRREAEPKDVNLPGWRVLLIAATMILLNVIVVIGLKARWVVPTGAAAFVLCTGGWWLLRAPSTSLERLAKQFFTWGCFWLALGFLFEPYEGGIKKDHATMSYYFITLGLALFMLIALTLLIDGLRIRRPFGLLIGSGQNPLIAYAGVHSLVPPVLGLLALDLVIEGITPTPWLGALRGAGMTLLVALAADFCSRRGIFLRA